MPQGPIPVTDRGNPALITTGPVGAATQISIGPGVVRSVDNLVTSFLTTSAIAALTTSQIGALYDVTVSGITSAMTALTTSQVAALSTSQLVALVVPTVGEVSLGGGNGLPLDHGLVFVPGAGQVGNILHE